MTEDFVSYQQSIPPIASPTTPTARAGRKEVKNENY